RTRSPAMSMPFASRATIRPGQSWSTRCCRLRNLGGSGGDGADALAIAPTTGEVYVAGFTSSSDFPGTSGGAQSAFGGGDDTFVARLNASLTALDQATYLGGSGGDAADALAIAPTTGEVYVAG